MNMKKMLTGLIAIGLILCQIQTVFGLETKSLQLISNSTNESLSNTTVTVLDVESSNSYYLNTDDEGYVIDDNQVLSTLDNKVLVLSAIYDSNVYNLCVDSLEDNQLYLEKDYEIEKSLFNRATMFGLPSFRNKNELVLPQAIGLLIVLLMLAQSGYLWIKHLDMVDYP